MSRNLSFSNISGVYCVWSGILRRCGDDFCDDAVGVDDVDVDVGGNIASNCCCSVGLSYVRKQIPSCATASVDSCSETASARKMTPQLTGWRGLFSTRPA